jgi:hypothetical protein
MVIDKAEECMRLPDYNTKVKVTVRHDCSWMIPPKKHVDVDIEGRLMPSEEWDPDNTIRVFTGDYNRPFCVIRIKSIVRFEDETGARIEKPKVTAKKAVDNTQTFQIAGSKGNTYNVTRKGDIWRCECVGFQMRGKCRHVEEAKGKK